MNQKLIFAKQKRLLRQIEKGLPVTRSISVKLLEKLEQSAQSIVDVLHEIIEEKLKENELKADGEIWLTSAEVAKKINIHIKTVGRYCRALIFLVLSSGTYFSSTIMILLIFNQLI